MSRFRRLLVPVAMAWLFVHASLALGGTVLLAMDDTSRSDIVCTCGHGTDHASCPMHRTSADTARCRLQSADPELDLALLFTLIPPAVTVATSGFSEGIAAAQPQGYDSTPPRHSTAPPDAPPPRA